MPPANNAAVTHSAGPTEAAREGTELAVNNVPKAFLATACVQLHQFGEQGAIVRALCDSGSMVNLITEDCVQRLGLRRQAYGSRLFGVGGAEGKVNGMVEVQLRPRFPSGFVLTTRMVILPKITADMPTRLFPPGGREELEGFVMADPYFHTPGRIDVLLGAEVWAKMIPEGVIPTKAGPTAQATHLGWIVFGEAVDDAARVHHVEIEEPPEENLEFILRKFWEIEQIPGKSTRSPADQHCEEIFKQTHYRDETGRYVVQIPIDPSAGELGSSRNVALRRFEQVERRLANNPVVREQYVGFMREYEGMNHMRPCDRPPHPGKPCVHIPHQDVSKKFRVVFDASCKTTTGVSLNDVQFVGEKLQDDLAVIIMRFRLYHTAITADVKKMFRQVRVDPSQWDLQRIFWRESPQDELREYWLTVVTYGMASSGFNAVRAMLQCAYDNGHRYPEAAEVVRQNFYMDDC